jgi:hypothetical protein
MSMSLDGYIAGPGDEPGNPGGDGFSRLHEWYGDSQPSGAGPSKASAEFLDEMNATGAVLAGRRTVEQVIRVIDTPEATHIRYRVRR